MYPSLAVDCTDQISSIAISDGNQVWQVENKTEKRQARKILSLVEQCLQQANIDKSQLKSICWGAGPGSFTGLRIATAVSQGLAYALNLPMLRVSSLEALAVSVSRIHPDLTGSILSVTDAHMGEYYWASFEIRESNMLPQRLTEDSLSALKDIQIPTDIKLVVGNGADKLTLQAGVIEIVESSLRAEHLFGSAEQLFNNGQQLTSMQAEPLYLRSKSAWKTLDEQKQGKSG
jgi:tRNA threonylcarbamoyladenosine biosynthesis protein TsaB